jgi:indolepyruvate ferredoxin oxidoreductase
MAAHLEGKGATVLDMSGLAQKYGAVMSHVQVAARPQDLHCTRIDSGGASLVVGCDLVVSASTEAVARMSTAQTRSLINASVTPTAEFVKNPDWRLPGSDLQADIRAASREAEFVPATEIAGALMGDAIATNMFMLGYAWQKGWVPLAEASLLRAIELNGVAVEFNQQSFAWGRRAAADPERVRRIAHPAEVVPIGQHFSRNLDEILERRMKFLAEYQDAAYADRYRSLVEKARAKDEKLGEAVARYYFKLLAYKDEYEVARLHADPAFAAKIEGMFEGDYKLVYHLAPPLLTSGDEPAKIRFGGWMLGVFRILKHLKGLRGTPFDIFGYTGERRTERALIAEYERSIEQILAQLTPANQAIALQVASLPEEIRGYGHVKLKSVAAARRKRDELMSRLGAGRDERAAA